MLNNSLLTASTTTMATGIYFTMNCIQLIRKLQNNSLCTSLLYNQQPIAALHSNLQSVQTKQRDLCSSFQNILQNTNKWSLHSNTPHKTHGICITRLLIPGVNEFKSTIFQQCKSLNIVCRHMIQKRTPKIKRKKIVEKQNTNFTIPPFSSTNYAGRSHSKQVIIFALPGILNLEVIQFSLNLITSMNTIIGFL